MDAENDYSDESDDDEDDEGNPICVPAGLSSGGGMIPGAVQDLRPITPATDANIDLKTGTPSPNLGLMNEKAASGAKLVAASSGKRARKSVQISSSNGKVVKN